MLNFRRLSAYRYEATAPSGATYFVYNGNQNGQTGWFVQRNGVLADQAFGTYAGAKEHANAVAVLNGDLEGDEPQAQQEEDAAESQQADASELAAEAVAEDVPADDAAVAVAETEPEDAPAEDAASPAQFTLIPETRPEGRLANVALSRIIRGWVQGAPAELVDSIRSYGVLQPVALVQSGRNEFEIADGRRRISAAEAAELGAVPALIFPEGTPRHVAAAITLTTNMQRRPNPASELEAIQHMVHDGASVDQIAQELRLSTFVIRRRMALANLIPEFRDALLTEELSVTVLQRVARHPHEEQRQLLATWRETGRITNEDRAQQRAARRGGQTDAVPAEAPQEAPAAPALPEVLRDVPLDELAHLVERMNAGDVLVPADRVPAPVVDLGVDDAEYVAPAAPARPAAPEVDLPTGQGWSVVLACLVRAEESLPVAPDDHTDAFYADLSGLLARVRRIAAAAA